LELFSQKGADVHFKAYQTYTTRQAIEEGSILDVLADYTNSKRYIKFAKSVQADKE